ncbi:MAG: YceI family protein [FCB group bacterium]|jgi:hypothetical protein|nr:YceI family protein [FCB group bacterium]
MKMLIALLAAASAAPAQDEGYAVERSESIFAVVTHKAGLASALAHNHLVYPRDYTAKIGKAGEGLETGRFSITFPTSNLVPDDPKAAVQWYPRLEALGILDKPFTNLSEKDRAKVREAMLSKEQLDAARFPSIRAEVTTIRVEATRQGTLDCTHVATIALTLHGKTVEREVPVRIEVSDNTVKVEGTARFRFREFGIKPYSAMLGALKVEDAFDLYVHLVARHK